MLHGWVVRSFTSHSFCYALPSELIWRHFYQFGLFRFTDSFFLALAIPSSEVTILLCNTLMEQLVDALCLVPSAPRIVMIYTHPTTATPSLPTSSTRT